jgi:HK97 family phage major capsid protein
VGHTDALITRYAGEIEERQAFIDGLVESAEKDGRDLDPKEMELITRARDRMSVVNGLLEPLHETLRITRTSSEKTAKLAAELAAQRSPEMAQQVQYRSAGEYIIDRWRAGIGGEEAVHRLDLYHRAAAHQTTGDNPGLLPDQILGPVINFIDAARPLVNFFGPRQLPSGSWSRPRVTQHTQIAPQSGEKQELVSRKMLIGKLPVAASTYGGYVNVSRQDVDWTTPSVMDIVVADLAAQYALETENAFADALMAAATAEAPLPTGAATAAQVTTAIWTAVGNLYAATKGAGRLVIAVSPDMLGTVLGPLYAPVNPQNSQSPGFNAADYGQGAMGSISGLPVIVSAGLDAGSILVGSTAAAEAYEDRIGSLQVVEPSVLGVQVAYAGYFADVVIEPTGLRKIAKTP